MEIDYLDIGRRVRAERKKQKISQEKLAEMVGVGTTHISHLETGNTKPSMKLFIAIVNALNLSSDELLRNHIHKAKHIFEGELASIIADCTDEEARIITDTAKSLLLSLRHKPTN